MKTTIQKLLVVALLISMISPIVAAPTQKTDAKEQQKAKAQDANSRSFKQKIQTACVVAGTLIVAYLIYRYKTRDRDLETLFNFEQNNTPKPQAPIDDARRLWAYATAHNENFQQAMRNPINAQNLADLFNDEEFRELVNNPQVNRDFFREQLRAIFNQRGIIQASGNDDFVQNMKNGINRMIADQRKV